MALPSTIQDRDFNNFKDNGDGTSSRYVYVQNPASVTGGDASAANQVIGNASLASIDSKLTAPLAVTLSGDFATETTLDAVLTELSQKTEPTDAQNIRALDFNIDTVDVSGSTVTLDASSLLALENITVTATDLDLRNLTFAQDKVDVSGSSVTATIANASIAVTGPLTDAELRATAVPISAASLPLPLGAATAADQATANISLSSIDSKLTSPLAVTGAFFPATQPVSAATLPLPTGAATSANQVISSASLASIDAKLNTLGQKTMANSVPVVFASDQSAVTILPSRGSITHTAFTATGVSQVALAANANRKYLIIHNPSTVIMWFAFGIPATTAFPSIKITSGATFTMESSFICTQSVNVIRNTSNVDFSIMEGV